jgi:hypothetical protein
MDLSLLPRGSGALAHGVMKKPGKSVDINIDGQNFSGTYAFVVGGNFTLASFSGPQSSSVGAATSVDQVGNGNIIASAIDGENLRCVFSYSGWSNSGTGTCRRDDGRLYDLQLAPRY